MSRSGLQLGAVNIDSHVFDLTHLFDCVLTADTTDPAIGLRVSADRCMRFPVSAALIDIDESGMDLFGKVVHL